MKNPCALWVCRRTDRRRPRRHDHHRHLQLHPGRIQQPDILRLNRHTHRDLYRQGGGKRDIQLADLSAIHVQYTTDPASEFGYGPATFFSYNLSGSGSSLDVETGIGESGVACVGAVAAFGFGQCGAGGVNGEVSGLDITQELARVTLISSVTTIVIPPQPLPIPGPTPYPYPQPDPVSPVPEPASLALLGSAMLPLAWFTRRLGAMRR